MHHYYYDGLYLVFESKVEVGQHVKTWRQQGHLSGNDAQFPFLCLPWVSADTDNVTTAQFVVDGHKGVLRLVVSDGIKHRHQVTSL